MFCLDILGCFLVSCKFDGFLLYWDWYGLFYNKSWLFIIIFIMYKNVVDMYNCLMSGVYLIYDYNEFFNLL